MLRAFESRRPHFTILMAVLLLVGGLLDFRPAQGQDASPEMIREAARRTGMSEEEIRAYLAKKQGGTQGGGAAVVQEPGREDLEGIDDSAGTSPFRDFEDTIRLPFDTGLTPMNADSLGLLADLAEEVAGIPEFFGADFFSLDPGMFAPPSFGPVPADYRLGVGDEVVVNAWGAIEFQETRIVDRDGSIILPRGGKVACSGQTLEQVQAEVRRTLARSHSTIDTGDGGDTTVEVSLGRLRSIRVFVVGAVQRPGSFEVSSVARMLAALYAAGGPTADGTMRQIRLVREAQTIAEMDLYSYLLEGKRVDDAALRDGDTIFVPDVGRRVSITGEVKRPLIYEMKPGETLGTLLNFSGGFEPEAVVEMVHIKRVVPPAERRPGQPDYTYLDIPFDPVSMQPLDEKAVLLDGDEITVGRIQELVDHYVDVSGLVKIPGRYQWYEGMTVEELLESAGGMMPEAYQDNAVIDRTSPQGRFLQVSVSLKAGGRSTILQSGDHLRIFARWENMDRPMVTISGEIHEPMEVFWREGMSLRDLILKAGGLKRNADRLRVEVARLAEGARESRDIGTRPDNNVEIETMELDADFLSRPGGFMLKPWDRIYVRGLPWWDDQSTVELHGEVFYPGTFSLIRQDERLSSLVARAGGLKPDAYPAGARVVRVRDDVGNIAIDLAKALANPGSPQDIILSEGDRLYIPNQMFTVKVVGEVGFPTSLVFEEGLGINDYVNRAGGYLEMADKDRARVVWPNGLSLPNEGGNKVKAGSTIIVPTKPPEDGKNTWEMIRDITSIVASLATVYVVVTK